MLDLNIAIELPVLREIDWTVELRAKECWRHSNISHSIKFLSVLVQGLTVTFIFVHRWRH